MCDEEMDLAIEAVEVCGLLLLFVGHFAHMNGHHSVWVLFKDEQYYSINEVCAGEIIYYSIICTAWKQVA